jgi:catechol 2,3-dioxygenase-like lactoylglutathione lyase family enzyme
VRVEARIELMSVLRMDHTGVVVDDLEAAVEFFLELGLERDTTGASEGEWLDRIIGLEKSNIEFAFVRTPDGNGRLELCRFLSPTDTGGQRPQAANELGLRHLCFAVDDLDAVLERLAARGFSRIGEIHLYNKVVRLCYIHGPEGIIVEIVERIG